MKTKLLFPLVVILFWVMTSCSESFDVNGVSDLKKNIRNVDVQTKALSIANEESVSVSDVENFLIFRMKGYSSLRYAFTPVTLWK